MLASAEPMDVASPEQMDGALPKYSPDCEVLAHFRILCAGCWNGSTVDNIVSTVKSLKLFSGLLHLWDICEPSRGALNDWPWIVMGDSGTLWSAKEVISYPEMTDCGLWWGQWHFVVSWGSWGHLLHWSDWLRVVMGDSGAFCGQLRGSSPTLKWLTQGCGGGQWHMLWSAEGVISYPVMTDSGLWWGTVAHAVVSWGGHLLPWSEWPWIGMGDSGAFCGQLRSVSACWSHSNHSKLLTTASSQWCGHSSTTEDYTKTLWWYFMTM